MSSGDVLVPPAEYRKGPRENRDDAVYIHKAKVLVNSIANMMNLSLGDSDYHSDLFSSSRILDIGCGPLRLITGLQASHLQYSSYVGIDVDKSIIDWANEEFGDTMHEFLLIDMKNARYSPQGKQVATLELPIDNDSFDIAILRSVFTHMTRQDIALYLSEISQKLKADGKLYLSINVDEERVLNVKNLDEYNARPDKGPLHTQIVSRQWFEGQLEENGLAVACFCPNVLNQPTYLIVKKP
jgi:SAM-dependent methyltransferase